MERISKKYLIEMANRAARRMRASGKFSEEVIDDMQKKATPTSNVLPSSISRKTKKWKQKTLKSGNTIQKQKAEILQNQQDGDNSGVSNVHTLQGSGNTATHLGTTKGRYVTQTAKTPSGNRVVNAGDHDAYKNIYNKGLKGQNAAANKTQGFNINKWKEKQKKYADSNTENQSLQIPYILNSCLFESFDEFLERKYHKQNKLFNNKIDTNRIRFLLEQLCVK